MFEILLALLILLAATLYFTYHHSYWKRKGLVTPPAHFVYGHSKQTYKYVQPEPLVIREWTKKYGKVFGFYEGVRKIMVTSDPDMINEVFNKQFDNFYARRQPFLTPANDDHDLITNVSINLFFSSGKMWKRLRAVSAPNFSVNSLKKIRPIVEDSAYHMVSHLSRYADKEESVDIYEVFQEFTFDIISRMVMGQDGSKMFENKLIHDVRQVFVRDFDNTLLHVAGAFPFIIPCILWIFRNTGFGPVGISQTRKKIREAVRERIREREKLLRDCSFNPNSYSPKDFIDIFLDMYSEEKIDDTGRYSTREGFKINKCLNEEEVVEQCMIFLIAGYDTTSTSMAYIVFLLSTHPEAMRRVQQEIDEQCANENFGFQSLSGLKYMENVIKESLRLYPLATNGASRKCTRSTTICGYEIEKGVTVQADTFTVHHSRELWGEDADQFNPDRWDSNEVRHPTAWFPFGGGPRMCIGMRLAYMEQKIGLIHILRKYDIVRREDSEKELELVGSLVVQPRRVTVGLRSRTGREAENTL